MSFNTERERERERERAREGGREGGTYTQIHVSVKLNLLDAGTRYFSRLIVEPSEYSVRSPAQMLRRRLPTCSKLQGITQAQASLSGRHCLGDVGGFKITTPVPCETFHIEDDLWSDSCKLVGVGLCCYRAKAMRHLSPGRHSRAKQGSPL